MQVRRWIAFLLMCSFSMGCSKFPLLQNEEPKNVNALWQKQNEKFEIAPKFSDLPFVGPNDRFSLKSYNGDLFISTLESGPLVDLSPSFVFKIYRHLEDGTWKSEYSTPPGESALLSNFVVVGSDIFTVQFLKDNHAQLNMLRNGQRTSLGSPLDLGENFYAHNTIDFEATPNGDFYFGFTTSTHHYALYRYHQGQWMDISPKKPLSPITLQKAARSGFIADGEKILVAGYSFSSESAAGGPKVLEYDPLYSEWKVILNQTVAFEGDPNYLSFDSHQGRQTFVAMLDQHNGPQFSAIYSRNHGSNWRTQSESLGHLKDPYLRVLKAFAAKEGGVGLFTFTQNNIDATMALWYTDSEVKTTSRIAVGSPLGFGHSTIFYRNHYLVAHRTPDRTLQISDLGTQP